MLARGPATVLEIQMLGNAHARQGGAVTNFETALDLSESRRAAEVFKDPYIFDFLGTTDISRERQVEQALADHKLAKGKARRKWSKIRCQR